MLLADVQGGRFGTSAYKYSRCRPPSLQRKNRILLLNVFIFAGTTAFYKDLEMMLGRRVSIWWQICWRFIDPALIIVRCSIVIYILVLGQADLTIILNLIII